MRSATVLVVRASQFSTAKGTGFKAGGGWLRRAFSTHQSRWNVAHDLHNIRDVSTKNQTISIKSSSNNVYHNLAIENYVLKHAHPESRIFFTYVNRPCVVIGRNQNPWLECNLSEIQTGINGEQVDIVRRRSGGGTVIHDAGNLNFSFIVPNDKEFSRNKHAQLVVEALTEQRQRRLEGRTPLYETVRVNERHDIVMRKTVSASGAVDPKEYKCSGSAFKLTRGRALHHGTLLLSSPNLRGAKAAAGGRSMFSSLLSSPAASYLEAKGVGSVRSPVHNLFEVESDAELSSLMHGVIHDISALFHANYPDREQLKFDVGDDDCARHVNEEIWKDIQELTSDDWRYCQTPSFDYTSLEAGTQRLTFLVKQGIIKRAELHDAASVVSEMGFLLETRIHEIIDWHEVFGNRASDLSSEILQNLATVFPPLGQSRSAVASANEANVVLESDVGSSEQVVQVVRRDQNGFEEVEMPRENTIVQR